MIDAEVDEIRRRRPVLGELMLHSAAHLQRVGRVHVGAQRLDALDADRDLPGEELLRSVTERIGRLQQVDRVGRVRRK